MRMTHSTRCVNFSSRDKTHKPNQKGSVMALGTINLGISYYPDPTKGRPLFNGSIFVGDIDTDPEIPANQKQVYIYDEGADVPIGQPVKTSSGGVPTYNGSAVQLKVEGNYSLKVLNNIGEQVYYIANNEAGPLAIFANGSLILVYETTAKMVSGDLPNGLEFELPTDFLARTMGDISSDDGNGNLYYIDVPSAKGITLDNGNVAVAQLSPDQFFRGFWSPIDDGSTPPVTASSGWTFIFSDAGDMTLYEKNDQTPHTVAVSIADEMIWLDAEPNEPGWYFKSASQTAAQTSYDNSDSTLSAVNVKDALDELDSEKPDTTYVDDALDLKADITYVDSELALKADLSDVSTERLTNPLSNLLKTNKLIDTLVGPLTWDRASTATYVDRYGRVRQAGVDEPRQEEGGWLIEGASENLISDSEDLTAAGANQGVVITDEAVTNPMGGATSQLITGDGTSSEHYGTYNYPLSVAGDKSPSVFVKYLDADTIKIYSLATGGSGVIGPSVNFTFSTKTGSGSITNVEELAGGWFRITLQKLTVVDQTTCNIRVYCDTGGVTTATTGVYAFGGQLEPLPFSSSYIPTSGGAATREADDATCNAVDNVPRLDEPNTVALHWGGSSGWDGAERVVALDIVDDSANARTIKFSPANSDSDIDQQVSGATYTFTLPNGLTYLDSFHIVSVYDGVTIDCYIDGVLADSQVVTPYTNSGIPVNPMYIGRSSGGLLNNAESTIKDLRFYDFALTDNEVAYLAGEQS